MEEYQKSRKDWMDPVHDQLLYNINIEYLTSAKALISNGHPVFLRHVLASITNNKENEWFFYHILSGYTLDADDIHNLLVVCLYIEKSEIFKFLCEEYPSLVKQVLEKQSDSSDEEEELTLLQIAILSYLLEEAKILVGLGANIHVVDEEGNTLLHLLCPGGNWMCHCYHPEFVSFLIDSGVDPSIQNKAELTAELAADIYGHTEHARYIRNYKANTSKP